MLAMPGKQASPLVKTRKSPLKDAPLRNPGQSVEEAIARLRDKGGEYVLIGILPVFLAALEWYRWWFELPPMPVAYTILAVIAVAWSGYRIVQLRSRITRLKLARDGERAVGQYLERLREKGYQVLHDLVGNKFNVDHVLVGPTGVFTVETKTLSKPARGKAEVRYDGQSLTVNGYTPDRDPVIQAKAQGGWLRELIEESTGKRFPVRSLVVYPGWYIATTAKPTGLDVLVLNPKGLPGLLEKLPRILAPEDIKLVNYHLSRYARTQR